MNIHTRKGWRIGRASATTLIAAMSGLAGLAALAHTVLADVPPVPFPTENPFSESKRVLGKILFFEEQLSTSNVVSCASCHSLAQAGADNRIARHPGDDRVLNTPDDVFGSPGIVRSDAANAYDPDPLFALRPQITDRAANSPINAAFAPLLFWDGRAGGRFTDPDTGQVLIQNGGALENQALQPIMNTIEMAHAGVSFAEATRRLDAATPLNLATNHPADVAAALAGKPSYGDLFERAFGDRRITAARIAMAIATYQRTLVSNQSPYDRFRAGQQNALTAAQQRGLQAFQSQGSRCNACHSLQQDLFTDQSFRNIGLRPIAEDSGRQAITGAPGDAGRFKVPGLRNVGLKRTFMHNGQFQTLTDVLRFYARAPGAPQQFPQNQDPIIPTIQLPPNAAADIQDFLANGLTDPRLAAGTAPFDRPTLYGQRPADQGSIVGGGVAGTGGVVPRIVLESPPMLGNREFRIGVDGALGGASLRLGISRTPPQAGRIAPTRWFDPQTAQGSGGGGGYATLRWPLIAGQVSSGEVLYAQWFITDPGASGGQALSAVGRIPIFCGSAGCDCGPADYNGDGFIDFFDYDGFVAMFEAGSPTTDFNADGFLDFFDYDEFVRVFERGC